MIVSLEDLAPCPDSASSPDTMMSTENLAVCQNRSSSSDATVFLEYLFPCSSKDVIVPLEDELLVQNENYLRM